MLGAVPARWSKADADWFQFRLFEDVENLNLNVTPLFQGNDRAVLVIAPRHVHREGVLVDRSEGCFEVGISNQERKPRP
jgi:hypothetical protein